MSGVDPQFHARAKEIFLDALGMDGSERAEFLDRACGDDSALRSEVLGLLEMHESATHRIPRDDLSRFSDFGLHDDEAPTEPEDAATRPVGRFAIGEVYAERYRILALLGRGGMGEVYKAQDLMLDVPVALKFLTSVNEKRRDSLLNEVRLARMVTHRNICRVYDIGSTGDEYFLTMEFVDGENLASLLRRIGRLPQDKLLDISRRLCAGLAAAHAKGVLHRDLKPANVILGPDGEVKITDFGIADRTDISNRFSHDILGTPAYMAPEVLSGRSADERSDLYSLGLLFYEMAVGRQVFSAGSITEYYDLHNYSAPKPPSQQIRSIDPDLEEVILDCLEKEPQKRPESALAVAARLPGSDPLRMALEAGATPSPEVVVAAGRSEPALSPVSAIALMVLLLVGLLGLTWTNAAGVDIDPRTIRPPHALADQAREILRDLGYDEPVDRAWGYYPNSGMEGDMAHVFWYRESASHMMPVNIFYRTASFAEVDEFDPPLDEPGMVRLLLDSHGRLIMLEAVSPLRRELLPEPRETDWNVALQAAGFPVSRLEPALTWIYPQAHADRLNAWRAPDPRKVEDSVHIDAASVRGKITFFDADPEKEIRLERGEIMAEDFELSIFIFYLTLLLLFSAAAVVARGNLKRGRGDRIAAKKLALATVFFNLVHWLLTASHVPSLDLQIDSLHASLGVILVEALFVWTIYLALEPSARRIWPQTLVSWSRLVRGQVRDPSVGRGLLIGSFVGMMWAIAEKLDLLAAARLRPDTPFYLDSHFSLNTALSMRRPVADAFLISINALYEALAVLFLLAVTHLILRRRGPALAASVLILIASQTSNGADPGISWLTFGVLIGAVSVYLLVRFGLVALTTAIFTQDLLYEAPLTPDLQVWFAEAGFLILVLIAGLAAFGAWLSQQTSQRWTPPKQALQMPDEPRATRESQTLQERRARGPL